MPWVLRRLPIIPMMANIRTTSSTANSPIATTSSTRVNPAVRRHARPLPGGVLCRRRMVASRPCLDEGHVRGWVAQRADDVGAGSADTTARLVSLRLPVHFDGDPIHQVRIGSRPTSTGGIQIAPVDKGAHWVRDVLTTLVVLNGTSGIEVDVASGSNCLTLWLVTTDPGLAHCASTRDSSRPASKGLTVPVSGLLAGTLRVNSIA